MSKTRGCLLLQIISIAVLCFLNIRTGMAETLNLTTGRFPFADVEAYYQMFDVPAGKDAPIILFLHGAKYSSDTWIELGTLQLLQSKGYRTAAVDLPGFGKTKHLPYIDNNMRAEFVKAALDFLAGGSNLTIVGAVLVTPSHSGRWAIPYLDRYGTTLKGWLPVAPAGVMEWGGPWEFTHRNVKMLAIYGDDDIMKVEADDLLKLFMHSKKVLIPGAKHACYIDKPVEFHEELIKFVERTLTKPKMEL